MHPRIRLAIGGRKVEPLEVGDDGLCPVQRIGCRLPSVLVSYVNWREWKVGRSRIAHDGWVLDSGAFSAWNSGTPIVPGAFIDAALEALGSPDPPEEVFALDEIPLKNPEAWRVTLANTEAAWARGVPAIPTWHVGEPEEYLLRIAADYPKIAVGGFTRSTSSQWKLGLARRALARVWPKRVHAFGLVSEDILMRVPFHTADSTYWMKGPMLYGQWRVVQRLINGQKIPGHGGGCPQRGPRGMTSKGLRDKLAAEVAWYVRVEDRLRAHWAKEMAELGS